MPTPSPSSPRASRYSPRHRRSRLVPRLVTLAVVAAIVAGAWIVWGLLVGGGEPSPATESSTLPVRPTASAETSSPSPDGTPVRATGASPPTPGALAVLEVVPSEGSIVGGEAVIVQGQGFTEGLTVRFGTRDAPDVEVLNPQTVRATLPPGLPGLVDVEVVAVEGTSMRLPGALVYVDRPPRVVMAVRPTLGTTAGGTAVTIVGTGFEPGARVVIGGERATEVEVVDSTRISAVTAAREEGLVDVVVRNPDLPAAILRQAYEYVPGPTLSRVKPNTIPEMGGVRITVTGTGFEPGAVVALNGLAATDVRVSSPMLLTAVAPQGILGPAVLVVVNPDQPAAVLADAVRYVPSAPSPAASPSPVPGEASSPAG